MCVYLRSNLITFANFIYLETCDSTCSAWSDWYQGRCSQTCDEGSLIHHRNRTCIHDDCQSIEKKSSPCLNQKPCPGILK